VKGAMLLRVGVLGLGRMGARIVAVLLVIVAITLCGLKRINEKVG